MFGWKKVKKTSADIAIFLAIFVSYFACAKGGLGLNPVSGFATLIWPPTGIALAAMLLAGYRFWPAIYLAAFLVNTVVGAPIPVAMGIGAGNTLEAVVAAACLRRAGFHCSLDRIRDVASLMVFGCLLSPLVSSTIGVASLWLGNPQSLESIGATWRAWWAGDALGDLIVAPLIFVWVASRLPKKFYIWKFVEAIGLALMFVVTSALVFESDSRLAFWFFPVVVWGALRFGQRCSVVVTFLISVLAIWETLLGAGPFSSGTQREGLFLLLCFMIVIATTGLMLAAAIHEREAALESIQEGNANDRLLSQAGKILTSSLDFDITLSQIAKIIVPRLADWCTIDLLEGAKIRRVAAAHADPKKEGLLYELQKNYNPNWSSPQPSVTALRAGSTYLMADVDHDVIKAHAVNEEHIKLIEEIGLKSYLAVPMISRSKVLGVIGFGANKGNTYGPSQINLAEEIARRAAVAIDNARLYEDVKNAVMVRDNFLSIASHELRTPLTSLYLQIQMLNRMLQKNQKDVDTAKFREKLLSSEDQAKQLGGLIDILLDVSKADAEEMLVDRETTNLVSLTKEVVDRFRDQAKKAGSQLIFHEPAEESNEGTQKVVGSLDKLRVSQAITNLLTNAIKYGNKKPIDVSLNFNGGIARVIVRDHGLGVPTKDQARIFDRFERAVSHHNISGLGLGLFIAREIARAHGGRIILESEVQKGSTFTLELPLRVPSQERGH